MNLYYLSTALNLASLYMISGAGDCFSLKSGELNIGGEGQIYAGGFLCAICLNTFKSLPAIIALSFSIIISMTASGLLLLFCAYLKKIRKVSIILSSYITSSAIIPLIDGLITGHFRGKSTNLLSTEYIPEKFRLHTIFPPGNMNFSFFLALALCLLSAFIIYKTSYGKKLSIFGISNEYAEFSNFNLTALSYSSAFISGALHGLSGALAILGTYYTCHEGFYISSGWNALTCALIAQSNPLLLLASSLFMGGLTTYSNRFALYHNYNFDISSLFQALFLLAVSFPIFSKMKGEKK